MYGFDGKLEEHSYKLMQPSRLFVFDFDHTIVDCNTDTVIYDLLPEKKLPPTVSSQFDGRDWNTFMQVVFNHLRDNNNTQAQINHCVSMSPITEGFKEVLEHLRRTGTKVIIVSDSNHVFIDSILRKNNLEEIFTSVFTNPASYEGDHLKVGPYELGHGCPNCRPNLCKTKAIRDFIRSQEEKGIKFQKVYFAGDGGNDFCPIQKGVIDVAFVRTGYPLEKCVKSFLQPREIHYWKSGHDILEVISKWI